MITVRRFSYQNRYHWVQRLNFLENIIVSTRQCFFQLLPIMLVFENVSALKANIVPIHVMHLTKVQ